MTPYAEDTMSVPYEGIIHALIDKKRFRIWMHIVGETGPRFVFQMLEMRNNRPSHIDEEGWYPGQGSMIEEVNGVLASMNEPFRLTYKIEGGVKLYYLILVRDEESMNVRQFLHHCRINGIDPGSVNTPGFEIAFRAWVRRGPAREDYE